MVLILDGSSEHGAHIWNESGISICERHLDTSKKSLNPISFFESPISLHMCATYSDLPSYISTMAYVLTQMENFDNTIKI